MVSTYLDEVVGQAREWDDARPRSSQGLGWSGMADCRAYMGYKIEGEWPSDDEENWRAIAGTGLHEWLTEVRRDALHDEQVVADFGLELTYGGIKGHADEIIWSKGEVTDYKFPRLASARVWDDPDVLEERFTQVHGYAAAIVGTEKWRSLAPDPESATVRLLVCPVDGTFADWAVYEEPFDRERADDALRRLREVREYLAEGDRPPRDKPYYFCERWCLAGETEVVTRSGIREIGDLAGQTHRLLVPSRQGDGLTWHGQWADCEIKSFGVQPLMALHLRRGRQLKTVYATAEHQWFVDEVYPSGPRTAESMVRRTSELRKGQHLRSIRRNSTAGLREIPVAVAQGFVYGDGSAPSNGAAASIAIYDAAPKDRAMLPYFGQCPQRRERGRVVISMLPRHWKQAPPLEESRSFLLSWLAGYLAADGTVSSNGQVTISSSRFQSMELVRSVCAIVGIGYGPGRGEVRRGFGKDESYLWTVTLRAADIPDWAFKIGTHRERAARSRSKNTRDLAWVVQSVEATGEAQEVYCAVVPGVEAFALADDLLTHNCEFFTLCRGGSPEHHDWPEIHDPELAAAIERYGLAGEQGRAADKLHKELRPLLQGLRGTARGWRISMTRPGPGRMIYDERKIAEEYDEAGRTPPLVPAPGAPPKLRVVREKR